MFLSPSWIDFFSLAFPIAMRSQWPTGGNLIYDFIPTENKPKHCTTNQLSGQPITHLNTKKGATRSRDENPGGVQTKVKTKCNRDEKKRVQIHSLWDQDSGRGGV